MGKGKRIMDLGGDFGCSHSNLCWSLGVRSDTFKVLEDSLIHLITV